MGLKTIAFMNQKGGVGKTTTTVSVGSFLANEYGKRVLLIDLDPQGNLSDHVGIDPNTTEKSVYNVLVEDMPAAEAVQEVCGMDVLPANIDLSAAEIELVNMMSREVRLKKAVAAIADNYDYILLDCPPSLGLLTVSGLSFASEVIVPMQAEYLALRGLSQLVHTVDLVKGHLNPELSVSGVIFCMFDGRTILAQSVKNEVETYFPGKVYGTGVRKNIRLAEAPSYGLPVGLYDSGCKGSDDYRAIAEEFLVRHGDEPKKKTSGLSKKAKIAANKPKTKVEPTSITEIDSTIENQGSELDNNQMTELGVTEITNSELNEKVDVTVSNEQDITAPMPSCVVKTEKKVVVFKPTEKRYPVADDEKPPVIRPSWKGDE